MSQSTSQSRGWLPYTSTPFATILSVALQLVNRLHIESWARLHCIKSYPSKYTEVRAAPTAAQLRDAMSAVHYIDDIYPLFHVTEAHRAAANARQLASLVVSLAASGPEADRAWPRAIVLSSVELTQSLLGKGSIYQLHEGWYVSEPDDHSEMAGEGESGLHTQGQLPFVFPQMYTHAADAAIASLQDNGILVA
ncbi:hypothetical protein SCUP515_12605 [Seiridium cupressi]